MYDLGDWNKLRLGIRELSEVGDGALLYSFGDIGVSRSNGNKIGALVGDVIHRRHIHANDVRQLAKNVFSAAFGST